MQKNNFIYRIFKILPSPGKFGSLVVEIRHKKDCSDRITIDWQCSPPEKNNYGWHGCKQKWEHDNYNLLPLLEKIKKAGINSSSTFEEVIDLLHANNVEHGLHTKLIDEKERQLFNGFISISEILNGKFTRYGKKKFLIPTEQQARFLEEIQISKKIKLDIYTSTAI